MALKTPVNVITSKWVPGKGCLPTCIIWPNEKIDHILDVVEVSKMLGGIRYTCKLKEAEELYLWQEGAGWCVYGELLL